MIMKKLLIIILLGLLINITSCSPPIICEGSAINFRKVYDLTSSDMRENLNGFISQHTNVLRNCRVTDYREIENSQMKDILSKYSMTFYNVNFSCDIINFSSEIYKKDDKFYLYYWSLGPCGKENVNFYDAEESGKLNFENDIIKPNLNKFDFCITVKNREYGENEYNEDTCNSIAAESVLYSITYETDLYSIYSNKGEAIIYCDRIKTTWQRVGCYRNVVQSLVSIKRDARVDNADEISKILDKARSFCKRLDNSIPENDSYKSDARFCFEDIER